MDFAVGSRGWCYILERHGLRKGDFDAAQNLITECRKRGALPLDICAEDFARETVGIERLDSSDIPNEVQSWVDYLRDHAHKRYTPTSFWDGLDVYVEVAAEKLDLRSLFEPVCAEFHVPITNLKGWSHSMPRRDDAEVQAALGGGRQCVFCSAVTMTRAGCKSPHNAQKSGRPQPTRSAGSRMICKSSASASTPISLIGTI